MPLFFQQGLFYANIRIALQTLDWRANCAKNDFFDVKNVIKIKKNPNFSKKTQKSKKKA